MMGAPHPSPQQPGPLAPATLVPMPAPMRGLLRLGAITWFSTWTLMMAAVTAPLQITALPFDRRRRVSAAIYKAFWGHGLFRVHFSVPMRRQGLEHVGAGPYIVASNHSSVLDIPAAFGLPVPLKVVIRGEHFQVPLVGAYLRLTGQVRLDRGSPEEIQQGLEAALSALRGGDSLLVFPEGTRSVDGQMGAFQRGAFRLSIDTGTPILPLVQVGHNEVMPKGKLLPRAIRHPVAIRVLPPVDPREFTTARALSRHVEAKMREAWAELRTEVYG